MATMISYVLVVAVDAVTLRTAPSPVLPRDAGTGTSEGRPGRGRHGRTRPDPSGPEILAERARFYAATMFFARPT